MSLTLLGIGRASDEAVFNTSRASGFPGQQRSCPTPPRSLSRLVVAVVVNLQMMCSSPLFPQGRPSSMFVCQMISALLPPQRSRSHISAISHPFFYPLPFSFSCTISPLFTRFIDLSTNHAIRFDPHQSIVYPMRTRCISRR